MTLLDRRNLDMCFTLICRATFWHGDITKHVLTRARLPLVDSNLHTSRKREQVSKNSNKKYFSVTFCHVLTQMCTPLPPEARCQKNVSKSVKYVLTRLLGIRARPDSFWFGTSGQSQLLTRRSGSSD